MKTIHISRTTKFEINAVRLAGILTSLALLYWILRTFDFREVGHALQNANYFLLSPVLVISTINFSIRSLRWGILFPDTKWINWNKLFASTMIGYLANNALPARAGELIRAYVLGERENISKSMILATIVVERVIDLVVALSLLTIVLFTFSLPDWLIQTGPIVGVVGITGILSLIFLNKWGFNMVSITVSIFSFLPNNVLNRAEAAGNKFVIGIATLRNVRKLGTFLGYTVLIWILEVTATWLISQAFCLPISIWGALFIVLVIGLGTMLPSSPGYVGTYEFFAISALTILGVKGNEALSFAVMRHAVTFIWSSFLGVLCLVVSGRTFASIANFGNSNK